MNASISPPRLSTSLVLLLIVALLPLLGLVTYTSLQNEQNSLAHARGLLLGTARLTALRHERSVEGARQLLGTLASAPVVKNQDLPRCMEYLKDIHNKYPFYTNLGLLDLNGNLVCNAVHIDGARFMGERFYFKQALATQSFVIGEYVIGRTSGRPSIAFGMPVVDDKGVVSGVAFAALDLEQLAGDPPLATPSAVSVTVTDRNGTLVGANTPFSSRLGTQALSTALFATVKALPAQAFDAVDQKGEPSIYAAVGVGNGVLPGLFVTASIARDAVLTPAKNQLLLALALLGLFAAIGVVGARWVAHRTILEPTRRLLKQVNALAGSDDADQADAPTNRQNELAGLTSAFDRMAAIVLAREAERDKAEQRLTTRLRQHEAIAQLSVEVASGALLEGVLQCATHWVADALAIDLCKVLQLTPDKVSVLLVAGVGWKPGLVGTALVGADAQSQAGYTLRADEPVLVQDVDTDARFEAAPLLAAHGVVSSLSVTIQVQGRSWGVLGADSRSPRGFTHDDTHFMQSVANLIALAIERIAAQAALLEHSRSMNEAQRLAHLGSWEFDLASQAFIWSDEMFRICGVEPSRFTGSLDEYLNVVHPHDSARVQAAANPMLQGLAPLPSEHRVVRPDGSIRHVHARGDLRLDHQGQAVAVCGTVLDVTDLRAAQVQAEEMAALLGEAQHIAGMGSWDLDVATGQMHWPVQTCRLVGIEAKDFGGTLDAAMQFVLPEDRQLLLDVFQSSAPDGSVDEMEFRIRRGDGEVRWIRKRGVRKCDALGQEVRRLGMVMDITDSKLAELRERDLSSKLTATLESITDGFYLIDKDWNFVYLNGQAEHMLQRSRHDLLGENLWQKFPSSVGSHFEHEYRHAVQAHCTARFEVFYPPLGTWFDVHAHPTDEGLAVYFQDITPRRLAQSQLRLLESAVSHLSDMVIITQVAAAPELEPKTVFVNNAFERRTGYCRDDVVGKAPEVLWETLLERSEEGSVATHKLWRPGQGEMLIQAREGDHFWLDVNAVALIDENEMLTHWVSVGRDITERRQARQEILQLNSELEERVRQRTAQLEAANQELEAFSYSVSHDLRSPLKTIEGFSYLLERAVGGEANEKAKHYLSRIRAGTRQMAELIDGLLSLAQLSRDTLQFSEVDLTAIARRVAQECREREPARRVEVRIQDAMRLQGDARLLSVVMQNLLGNAWKFTARQQDAHIEIGSHAGTQKAIGETVYFIKDNGAGFDMAHADKLFGTFERLHSPSDFSGTGIGLATVKRVIERHAGRVWAQGQEGEGATFYFTLGSLGMTLNPEH